jgi:uncharacterized hydrophobic protein (TIGR00341 family)
MKIVEVLAPPGHADSVSRIANEHEVADIWYGPAGEEDGRQVIRLYVSPANRQTLVDRLAQALEGSPGLRIAILPVEATLPRPESEPTGTEEARAAAGPTREELYQQVVSNTRLDGTYLLLVVLSTIVATIGMLADNVAVVIGAMVIAPLLGPNLALALGAALGDTGLIADTLKTNLAGMVTALGLSALIGLVGSVDPAASGELAARTDVGLASIALALASGGAAVLSLTGNVPTALVGVMVAVALLPPTATLGLMVGDGHWGPAAGAALLLAVNVVCVNLAANLVFLAKGIHPRTWAEKQKARRSLRTHIVFWVIWLGVLLGAVVAWQHGA